MKFQSLTEGGTRQYLLVLDPGDEVIAALTEFAANHSIRAAAISGIGAFSEVTLGFFELDRKAYKEIPVPEQVEVLSLLGNMARFQDSPRIHAHVTIGRADGTTLGGHLLRARVQPTLEILLTEFPSEFRRQINPATDLPLLVCD